MVTSVYNMMVWDIQIIWSQLAKLKYDFTLFKESSTLTQEDAWLYVYVGFKMASGLANINSVKTKKLRVLAFGDSSVYCPHISFIF